MNNANEMGQPLPPLANYALLPMLFWRLLLSVARQKHSPDTAKTVASEYDYVIIGGGTGGNVVASRLSELPCVTVLMLEAGKTAPLLTEVPGFGRLFWYTQIDWKYRTAPQRYTGAGLINRQLAWPQGKTIGGSSVLNAMLNVRGNRINYDRWEAEGAKGWGYKDVFPYFIKLEDNRDPEYVANGYHGVEGPLTVHRPRYEAEVKRALLQTVESMGYQVLDSNGPRQTGFYDFQSTLRGGQRCSTAKAYLVPAETRENLDILPGAFVRKVLIKNRRAVGVLFDHGGKTYEVRARREVIMSAGTVNSAQLLKLSGIGPREELKRFKIPVIADLPVGMNLQDHIGAITAFVLPSNIQTLTKKLLNPLNIEQYIQNRTGPLTSCEFGTLLAFLKNGVIAPKVDFPDHQLYLVEGIAEIAIQVGVTPRLFKQVLLPYIGRPLFFCISQVLHPKSRGTVTLRSTDPYVPPIIDPNYLEDPSDVRDMVEGLKTCNRIFTHPIMRAAGLVPIETLYPGCEQFAGNEDLYLTCIVRTAVATFSHQVGTARMGDPRDPRTVVDPYLRVLRLKGLRVIDASVMPLIPSANTNTPTIMVAEKASDIIKSTIKCHGRHVSWWNETVVTDWSDQKHSYPAYSSSVPNKKPVQQWNTMENPGFSKNPQKNPIHSYLDPHVPDVKLENEPWEDESPVSTKEESLFKKDPHIESWNEEFPNTSPWKKDNSDSTPWNQKFIETIISNEIFALNRSLSPNAGNEYATTNTRARPLIDLKSPISQQNVLPPSKIRNVKMPGRQRQRPSRSRVKAKLQNAIQQLLSSPLVNPTMLSSLRNLKIT